MKKKPILLVILFVAFYMVGHSQTVPVSGRVTSKSGDGLPFATITVKGTTNGTTTDSSGNFSITVPTGSTLVVSFQNLSKEFRVTQGGTVSFQLDERASVMSEVVVVGFGNQRKQDITSAISSISTSDIANRPISNTAEVLAGKAPGVQVIQPSGKPGADSSVRIRGISSVLGSSQPIFVVDGVITYDTKSIDPNNIESMSVLKDASAAGIYGSAGATNGVVLITTKKGQRGKSKVELHAYTGFQKIVKTLDMMNGEQLAELLVEEKRASGDMTFTVDPALLSTNLNWQDEVYRTAPMTGVNLGLSGGSEKGTYFLGLGYLNQDGIVVNSNFTRYSLKFNLEQSMNKWLTIGTHANYNRSYTVDVPDNSRVNQGGVVLGALSTPPFVDKYNSDGTFALNPFQAWENPLASIEGPQNKTVNNHLLGDVYGTIQLMRGLKFRSQFGIYLTTWNWDYFLDPFRTQYGRSKSGVGQNANGEDFQYNWDNTLTYDRVFDDHSLNVVIGSQAIETRNTSGNQYGEGFATGSIPTLNAASTNRGVSTFKTEWSLYSYFGRINYGFNDKYLLTASLRRDGSSRFGTDNRFGYFPAVSAGWRISREDFMDNMASVNDLKLRIGYGKTGNLPTGLYPTVSPLGTGSNYSWGGMTVAGIVPTGQIGNPELKWESTSQVNLGFDLTIFNQLLTISADYYNKNTKDLIFQEFAPRSTGFDFRYANSNGTVQNRGFEFNIIGNIFNSTDVSWTSTLNMSFNKNIVKDVDSGRIVFFGNIPERGDAIVFKEGLPLGAFWGFIADGVDPATGNVIFRDLNKDGMVDPDNDRTYLGSALPKFTFGFTNEFSYKSFSLSMLIDGVSGNKVLNATRIETEGMFDVKNSSTVALNRWRNPGDVTDVPRAIFSDPDQNSRISTRFIEDGSFVRIRNLTLSYRLTPSWFGNSGISGVRVYFTAQNLHTFTSYKGYHPEVNAYGTNAISQGIDYGTYPQAKVFTFGINLDL